MAYNIAHIGGRWDAGSIYPKLAFVKKFAQLKMAITV